MINSNKMINVCNNTKQLTVGQLMDALSQCDRGDLVKFFDTDAITLANVAFVERYATGNTVYLHSEKPDLTNFSSPAALDESSDLVSTIIVSNENFVKTIWGTQNDED